MLLAGNLSGAVAELQRRAALGSAHAATLLAFLQLRGAITGVPNLAAAEELCSGPARAGYAYAQYVLGWVNWARGNASNAVAWIDKACVGPQPFLPAWVDLARLILSRTGFEDPDPKIAMEFLRRAHRAGHKFALVFLARAYMSGDAGSLRRLAGLLILPMALARVLLFGTLFPFSDRVFINDLDTKRPLFQLRTLAAR